ncbi:glucans biosynthesis glucosyltransferase MdoH [Methylovirgula sp. 4M-Z18]|nr:glucans biosynthesis glucosyltransferase MdoH [Methylovirgula sp. 4M-Z18]
MQDRTMLTRRRLLVTGLILATYFTLAWMLADVLGQHGWSIIDLVMFASFLVAAPWSVIGLWNAVIGFCLLHLCRDGMAQVAPFAKAAQSAGEIHDRTAILLTLRHEDPARAFQRIHIVKESLDATGFGAFFSYFILSDSDDPEIAQAEERAFADWSRAHPEDADRLIYRRRTNNEGFKAGNLQDFCTRWGQDFTFMLPLDADSLMDGKTIMALVRMGAAHPKIGILQSLVVGTPTDSAFARIFQFGMRHGMRTYTMGNAWWAGDCGPFWGHNALVRIAPFLAHCTLPQVRGRAILSHDQIEAVLMRRAGFEVRVWPQESGSYEDNPPTLLEFTRRDLRWCQGNLQYLHLLGLPGLQPMSRFQLVWAIMMFLGLPGWTLLIALASIKPLDGKDYADFHGGEALALYLAFLFMYLAPKLAGFLDVAMSRRSLRRYGGLPRFVLGACLEVAFSFLIGAATTLRTSLFMIGLLFGRTVTWNGQARDAYHLSWSDAWRGLWPQQAFGVLIFAALFTLTPSLLWWSLPLTLGYLVAVPFAVLTGSARFGAWLQDRQLCAIPEEFDPPPEIAALTIPITQKEEI